MYWKVVRDEIRLRKARTEIKEAQAIIDTAKKGCGAAAEQVLQSWEGDAATAFAKEQQEFSSWITKMLAVIGEVTTVMANAEKMWAEVDAKVTDMIKEK